MGLSEKCVLKRLKMITSSKSPIAYKEQGVSKKATHRSNEMNEWERYRSAHHTMLFMKLKCRMPCTDIILAQSTSLCTSIHMINKPKRPNFNATRPFSSELLIFFSRNSRKSISDSEFKIKCTLFDCGTVKYIMCNVKDKSNKKKTQLRDR